MKSKALLLKVFLLICNCSFSQYIKYEKKPQWIKFLYPDKYSQNEKDRIGGRYFTNFKCPSDTINVLIHYGSDITFDDFLRRIRLEFNKNSSNIKNHIFQGCTVPKFYEVYHYDFKNERQYKDETYKRSKELQTRLREEGKSRNEISLAASKLSQKRKEEYNYYPEDKWLMTLKLEESEFVIFKKSETSNSYDEKYKEFLRYSKVDYKKNDRKNSKLNFKSFVAQRLNAKDNLTGNHYKLTLNNFEEPVLITFLYKNGRLEIIETTRQGELNINAEFTKESGYEDEDFIVEDIYYRDRWFKRQFKIVVEEDTNQKYLLEKLKYHKSITENYKCIGKLELVDSTEKINKDSLLEFSLFNDFPYPEMSNPSDKIVKLNSDWDRYYRFVNSIYYGDYKRAKEFDYADYFAYLHNQFLIEYSKNYKDLLPESAVFKKYNIQTIEEDGYGRQSVQLSLDYEGWMEQKFAKSFIYFGNLYQNYGPNTGMSNIVREFFKQYKPEDPEFQQMFSRIESMSYNFKNY